MDVFFLVASFFPVFLPPPFFFPQTLLDVMLSCLPPGPALESLSLGRAYDNAEHPVARWAGALIA